MCLYIVELASPSIEGPYLDDKLDLPKFGWKVIIKNENSLESLAIVPFKYRNTKKWQKDTEKGLIEYYSNTDLKRYEYPSGFHVYLDRIDALHTVNTDRYSLPNIRLIKVEFKDIVAIGRNHGLDIGSTVVARQIKILS